MKIKDNKCKCGRDDFFFADKGNQTGIYCSYCGKWLKWADKDEQNLRMKQEPCEDCVSRQAVLELVADYDLSMGQVVKGIHALPPVTPQPKTGHWIYISQSEINGLKICKCSECGKRTYGSLDYCGNCGAKMFEPQESEDKE